MVKISEKSSALARKR